ncbi:hypothetical protein BCON_0301g00100 [Botryotinia convoluta]|uniref:Uncharacterized protein n=1 Tax=Botryotinia convoluta TaxID=54673 RepID=A0A4Z1HCU4_9HELO|nr:hypothetical protein BCON_0301g00100 [Botryotinia convoluta]
MTSNVVLNLEAFCKVFMLWLNTADIRNASVFHYNVNPETLREPTLTEKLSQHWDQLIDCYLMADYIKAPRYTNFIMNALTAKLKEFEGVLVDGDLPSEPLCNSCAKTVNIVWTETITTSPLRKLILDTLGSTRHIPWNMTKTLFSLPRH